MNNSKILPSMVIKPDYYKLYPELIHGEGIYLYDTNNKKYIDASGGASAASSLGHGNHEISQSIYTQVKKLSITPTHYFTTEVVENYLNKLSRFTPKHLDYGITVSGGSEAVESAIKISKQYFHLTNNQSKYKVIGRYQSYHGSTILTLDIGGNSARKKIYNDLLNNHLHISPPYCYRCPFNKKEGKCNLECALELENLILREGPDTVSSFIFEPVVGASLGAVASPKGYMKKIREICDKYNVLMIADEVMTGFGRTGYNFGVDFEGISPDIIALGKGMSGGYFPLGGVIIHSKIYNQFKCNNTYYMGGHTFACNPVGASVGLKTLEIIKEKNLVENSHNMGLYLKDKLLELKSLEFVGDVRGRGLLIGIEFVQNKTTKEPFKSNLKVSQKIGEIALKKGLIVYPGTGSNYGIDGDHIKIAPPLTINKFECDKIVEILKESIIEFTESLGVGVYE